MILEKYLNTINEAGEYSFEMYKKYGTVALLTVSPSVIYNYIFRQSKKLCTRACKSFQTEPECWYKCYIRSVNTVRAAIRRDAGRVNSIPDPNERRKLRGELETQIEKWDEKEEKLRDKLARLG
jgi:hypothetical protein